MAVRTDAASDYLLRSANLPSSTAFTVCGWAVMDVDKNTDTTLATLENALTAATSGYYLTTGATGTELIVYSTALPGASATLISMAVGTPFFWAMSANGAGAGLLKVSARTVSENSLTSVTNTSGSFTSAALYIGNEGYGLAKPFDGRHWNVKCWDRALTDAELLVESFFDRVMYPSSLNFHWPLHDVNDTSDRSGNGRDATVGGTLTSGDSISNLWKPSPKFWTSGVAIPGVTGVSATSQVQTSAASGTASPANVTAAVASSQAQTSAATGTHAPAAVTAASATSQAQTSSASGVQTFGITGNSATSQAQTSAASGTHTPAAVTGTSATSQAQTSSASGAQTFGVTADSATSQAQTSAASGTAAPAAVTGVSASSQAQTSSASGTAAPAAVTAASATSQAQTSAASGVFVAAGSVSGTSATSQAQTSAASGTFTPPVVVPRRTGGGWKRAKPRPETRDYFEEALRAPFRSPEPIGPETVAPVLESAPFPRLALPKQLTAAIGTALAGPALATLPSRLSPAPVGVPRLLAEPDDDIPEEVVLELLSYV